MNSKYQFLNLRSRFQIYCMDYDYVWVFLLIKGNKVSVHYDNNCEYTLQYEL